MDREDLPKLSKEDLLRLVVRMKSECELLQAKNSELQEINERLLNQLTQQQLASDFLRQKLPEYIKSYSQIANREILNCSVDFNNDSIELVFKACVSTLDKLLDAAWNATQLQKTFKRGGEKTPKQVRKETNKISNNIKNTFNGLAKNLQGVEKNISRLRQMTTLCSQAAQEVANTSPVEQIEYQTAVKEAFAEKPLSEEPSPFGKTLLGRRPSRADRLPAKKSEPNNVNPLDSCPDCGERMETLGEVIQRSRTITASLEELSRSSEALVALSFCGGCGHVHATAAPNADLPVLPTRTISHTPIIEAMRLSTYGLSLDKSESLLLAECDIGNDTFQRNCQTLMDKYFSLIVERIHQRARQNKILLVDETHFDCLEQQGQGNCRSVKLAQSKDDSTQATSSKTRVLTITNANSSTEPFVIYKRLPTRSAQSIGEALSALDLSPEVMVTDSYPAYDTLAGGNGLPGGCGLQNCLTHLRRKVLDVSGVTNIDKALQAFPDEPRKLEYLKGLARQKSPQLALTAVLKLLSLIIHDESVASVRKQEETENEYLKRAQNVRSESRRRMDLIQVIMYELAKTEVQKDGNRYKTLSTKPCGKAVVYYMNNEDAFRYFLNDIRVPCQTNAVERAIRPLTLLRKNVCHAQSINGMDTLMSTFTLFRTIEICGIKRPIEYLVKFCRALYLHCYAKGWTEAQRQEMRFADKFKNPNTELRINWPALWLEYAKDFDVTPWLPWNYAETEQ